MALFYLSLGLGFIGGWISNGLFVSRKARRLQILVDELRATIEAYQAPPGPGLRPGPSED